MKRKKDNFTTEPFQPSLFSAKEEYLFEHNAHGVRNDMAHISYTRRKKRSLHNLHLRDGMSFSSKHGFAILEPYNGTTDFQMLSYAERNKSVTIPKAIHFFMDDYKFISPIWHKLEATTRNLVEFEFLFAPDFSVYLDVAMPINLYNIYMSRFVAAYWQHCGFSVIPTASWGDAESFDYCFEGLPGQSVIAVCGIGHEYRRGANKLWHMAMHEMEKQISPTKIIVYGGKQPDATQFNAEIVYFEDYITTHFR